ncbi:hypothetical protein [Streptomyces sp. NPDC001292]|uniref:hypothetical protein n=1 Tax=Streptomyces sp. NPDC001292 TaxID=3364558 RepID=UPI00367F3950
MRAWRRWYRRLHHRWGTVLQAGLTPEAVGDVLTRLGTRAGLDIRPNGHSPGRGLVTESSRAGNPDAVAEKQGGWAKVSTVMRRYREAGDGFTENALHGVLQEPVSEPDHGSGLPSLTHRAK